ncbi:MAG TPA: response regulator [Oculatellaceae cyanobacterium]
MSESFGNHKVVLVVDDNATMRKLLTAQLTKLGVASDTANDGQEALDKIANTRYRMVFMDVQMPVMDGLEATKRLRDREKETGNHETIVALTGHCSRADCLAAGMDDYVAKPMNIATLKKVVEKWVDEPQPAST